MTFLLYKKSPNTIGLSKAYLVPVVGLEPTRYCYHWILSPARLPIPPHRHISIIANILINRY